MRPQTLPPCLPLISFLFFCLAFACLFFHLWCYFSSNEFLPLYCFFSLALFEFESLLVLKIPFSVRLGFLPHLKFLISEYLSHFCSDSLFCNGMSVKKEPNSCLLFLFFFHALKLGLAYCLLNTETTALLRSTVKGAWNSAISKETAANSPQSCPTLCNPRLPCPWDSPGKNTGVSCHFLLQCTKVKTESEVAHSCPTLSNLMDCSPPGSSDHGIFQARVLEWGAIASKETREPNFPVVSLDF